MKIHPLIRVLWKQSCVWLLLLIVAANLVNVGLDMDLSREHWASWVQAVGSITALGVAIFVMSKQNENALHVVRIADQRALVRRANAISALVSRAQNQTRSCCDIILFNFMAGDAAQQRSAIVAAQTLMGQTYNALVEIPTHELGSFDMASGIHEMIDAINNYLIGFNTWLTRPEFVTQNELGIAFHISISFVDDAASKFNSGASALEAGV